MWGYEVSVETFFNQINGISKMKLVQSSYDKKNPVTQLEETIAWKIYIVSFFLIGVTFLNETGL